MAQRVPLASAPRRKILVLTRINISLVRSKVNGTELNLNVFQYGRLLNCIELNNVQIKGRTELK
jgi:hypothetical protein